MRGRWQVGERGHRKAQKTGWARCILVEQWHDFFPCRRLRGGKRRQPRRPVISRRGALHYISDNFRNRSVGAQRARTNRVFTGRMCQVYYTPWKPLVLSRRKNFEAICFAIVFIAYQVGLATYEAFFGLFENYGRVVFALGLAPLRCTGLLAGV